MKQTRRKSRGNHTSLSDTEESDNSLKQQLYSFGLKAIDTKGDGNCLFRALAHQMNGSDHDYKDMRAKITTFLAENPQDYSPFVPDEDFNHYITRMKQDKVFGGNVELVAFTKLFERDVWVFQANSPPWIIKGGKEKVLLALHSYEHYSSVVPLGKNEKIVLKSSDSDKPSKIESGIMKTTGKNLDIVREALRRTKGNVDEAFNLLWEMDSDDELLKDSDDELVEAMKHSLHLTPTKKEEKDGASRKKKDDEPDKKKVVRVDAVLI